MKVKSIPVCVRIPEPIYKKLEEMTKNSTSLSIPEQIRRILDEYFKNKEVKN